MEEKLIKLTTTKSSLVFKAGSAVESFRKVPDVIQVGGPTATPGKLNHYDCGINFRSLVSEATPEAPEIKEVRENGKLITPFKAKIDARDAIYAPIEGHTTHITVEWPTPPSDAQEEAAKEVVKYLMANQEEGYGFTLEILK